MGRQITLQRGFDITGADERTAGIPVISSGGVSGYSEVALIKGPGVVIGRKGTLGTVHYCETDYWPHDTTLWVRDFGDSLPRFVYHMLRHLRLEHLDTGTANPTLNRNQVHPLTVRWPNRGRQMHIASALDRASAKWERMTLAIQKAAGHLKEYRLALITAAVTGQMDVGA